MSRLSLVSTAAVLALLGAITPALADDAPISCTRLSGLEKAQCLVKQRQQTLQMLGRMPASSASSAVSSGTQSSVTEESSSTMNAESSSAMPSCSRAFGVARAKCLVEQRQAVLKALAAQPKSSSSAAARTAHPSCSRYRMREERERCLRGEKMPVSSSSSSATSSSSVSSSSNSSSSK